MFTEVICSQSLVSTQEAEPMVTSPECSGNLEANRGEHVRSAASDWLHPKCCRPASERYRLDVAVAACGSILRHIDGRKYNFASGFKSEMTVKHKCFVYALA